MTPNAPSTSVPRKAWDEGILYREASRSGSAMLRKTNYFYVDKSKASGVGALARFGV